MEKQSNIKITTHKVHYIDNRQDLECKDKLINKKKTQLIKIVYKIIVTLPDFTRTLYRSADSGRGRKT